MSQLSGRVRSYPSRRTAGRSRWRTTATGARTSGWSTSPTAREADHLVTAGTRSSRRGRRTEQDPLHSLDDGWLDHDVFEMSPRGRRDRDSCSGQGFLRLPPGVVRLPAVSPDGRNVLFRSQRSGWFNYWVAPIAGGEPRQVAPEQADQVEARWSPDGRQILFLSMTNGTQSLKIVPAAGGSIKTLVDPAVGMVTRAEWSPDSRRISYTMGTPTTAPELYVVDAGGGTPKQLTFSEGNKLASAAGHAREDQLDERGPHDPGVPVEAQEPASGRACSGHHAGARRTDVPVQRQLPAPSPVVRQPRVRRDRAERARQLGVRQAVRGCEQSGLGTR